MNANYSVEFNVVEVQIVPYDDNRHRDQLIGLYMEYCNWLDEAEYGRHGVHLVPDCGKFLESFLPRVTSIKPPEGIILVLEVDGEAAGTVRLSRLVDGAAEVNQMYVNPKFRGCGYGYLLMERLEEKAREFGYSVLRLDTRAWLNHAALHMYRKLGFEERSEYPGASVRPEKIYMEKKL